MSTTVRPGLALAQPPIRRPGIPQIVRLARRTGIAPTRHVLTTATAPTLRPAPIPLREALRLHTALPLLIPLVEVALIAVAAAHTAAEEAGADLTVAAIAEWICLIPFKLR
jgi:hypothetical protein